MSMNGRILPQLVILFILAVGVSVGVMILIMNSRDVVGNSGDVGDMEAELARVKADLTQTRSEVGTLSADLSAYQRRVASLEERNTNLARLNVKESGKAGEELSKADAEKLANLSTDEKALRAAVDDVLTERRTAEELKRREERAERREQWASRTQEWLNETYTEHLKKLIKELDLTGTQEADIKVALDTRREGITKMYAQHSQDVDQGERVNWEDINKQYQEQLENILTKPARRTRRTLGRVRFTAVRQYFPAFDVAGRHNLNETAWNNSCHRYREHDDQGALAAVGRRQLFSYGERAGADDRRGADRERDRGRARGREKAWRTSREETGR
jgi:hypothetical protein